MTVRSKNYFSKYNRSYETLKLKHYLEWLFEIVIGTTFKFDRHFLSSNCQFVGLEISCVSQTPPHLKATSGSNEQISLSLSKTSSLTRKLSSTVANCLDFHRCSGRIQSLSTYLLNLPNCKSEDNQHFPGKESNKQESFFFHSLQGRPSIPSKPHSVTHSSPTFGNKNSETKNERECNFKLRERSEWGLLLHLGVRRELERRADPDGIQTSSKRISSGQMRRRTTTGVSRKVSKTSGGFLDIF